jgi:type III secretion protein T
MLDLEPLRQFLIVFALCMVRISAACTVVPFMGGDLVQGRVRNSLLFSWGIIIYPIVSPTLDADLGSVSFLLAVIAKEVVLGILIGFIAAKLFWVAMSIGFFIDNQRGASMASTFDPMSGEQTSPLGQFLQQAIIVLFYSTGGFLVFLAAIFESYVVWPLGTFFPTFDAAFPGFLLEIVDRMMWLIVVLAAPVIVTVFVAEFGLGLVNRFAPQLNVFFLAMPVKSLIGLLVLVLYLPFLMRSLESEHVRTEALLQFLRTVLA